MLLLGELSVLIEWEVEATLRLREDTYECSFSQQLGEFLLSEIYNFLASFFSRSPILYLLASSLSKCRCLYRKASSSVISSSSLLNISALIAIGFYEMPFNVSKLGYFSSSS
jgi:hypothetical protein